MPKPLTKEIFIEKANIKHRKQVWLFFSYLYKIS